MTGIYKIVNKINGKIYVGQAKNICGDGGFDCLHLLHAHRLLDDTSLTITTLYKVG